MKNLIASLLLFLAVGANAALPIVGTPPGKTYVVDLSTQAGTQRMGSWASKLSTGGDSWYAWAIGNLSGLRSLGGFYQGVFTLGTSYVDLVLGSSFNGAAVSTRTYLSGNNGDSYIGTTTGANLGVGTNAPAYNLDVAGTFRAVGNALFGGTISASGSMTVSSVTVSGTGGMIVKNGRTTLQAASEPYALRIGRDDNASTGFYLGNPDTSASPNLVFSNNAGTARVTFTDGGSVGIGTASPANPLHVSGDTSGNIAWFESKLANSATVYIQAASGAGYIGTNGQATFALRTNTVDRVIVPNAAVTTGGALCLNASKVLSKCTSVIDVSGNCTCP